MSLPTVIKNVYTFANILSQAGTEAVKHWDIKSLKNAFNWATYCEKIEEQTRGKPYRYQLNQQLQSLTLLLIPVTLLDLSLEKLEQATVYLGKVLLENPSIRSNLKKAVLNKLANTDNIQNQANNDYNTWKCGEQSALNTLMGGTILSLQDSSESYANVVIQSLERLKKASSNKQRYERFLQDFLSELTSLSVGWKIVLTVLLTGIENEENHCYVEEIKTEIFQWIVKQDRLTCYLWKMDSELICEVCARDDQFYKLYQQHVITWAQGMEPVYGLTEHGDLYHWCFQGKETEKRCLCYNTLVNHVLGLIRHDINKRWNFENHIKKLSEQSYFNVWCDILKSVKEKLK